MISLIRGTNTLFTYPLIKSVDELLHGILRSPLSGRAIVPSLVRLQKLSNVRNKGVFGVRVSQEGANGKQDLANGQCRTPLVLQNVQANTAVRVDVAVINTCSKMDLGRLSATKYGRA